MILLDTHVLVWLQQEPRKLSPPAEAAIRRARSSSTLAVSAITIVELGALLNRGRLRSTETTAATIHRYLEQIAVLPLTDAMAVESSYMPVAMLPDPMDSIIAATARSEGIPLVTADQRVQNCTLLKTIW